MAHVKKQKLSKTAIVKTSVVNKNKLISAVDNAHVNDSKEVNKLKDLIDKAENVSADDTYEAIGMLIQNQKLPLSISKIDIFKADIFKPQQQAETIAMEETRVPPILSEGNVCPICESRRTVEMSKQNRSGDEATRAFTRCLNCQSIF